MAPIRIRADPSSVLRLIWVVPEEQTALVELCSLERQRHIEHRLARPLRQQRADLCTLGDLVVLASRPREETADRNAECLALTVSATGQDKNLIERDLE